MMRPPPAQSGSDTEGGKNAPSLQCSGRARFTVIKSDTVSQSKILEEVPIKMKKFFRIVPLLVVVVFALAGAACAAEKIGVADMQKVLVNHPRFKDVSKRIEAVYRAKEQELKTALDKVTDKKQGAQMIQGKRQEAAQEEIKLKEPIYKEIRAAVRTVAKNKGITVVLDIGAVMFGGQDITDDVVAELKKKK